MVHKYCIAKGDEDNSNGNDQTGTRAYPSRTYIGLKASLGEKHAWVLQPLNLFWGLVSIHEYAYRFKLPVAKSELMVLDIPRVEYEKADRKSPKKEITSVNPNDRSIKLNEASVRKMEEKRKMKEWTEINLSDLNTRSQTFLLTNQV